MPRTEMSDQRGRRSAGWETLIRGLPGHPLHPPLTDATIGMFTLAAGLAVIGYAGAIEEPAGKAMWLALIGGLIVSLPTAMTGFVDWLTITWGTPRWRAATFHLSAMLVAVALFALAAWQQHDGYRDGDVTAAGLILTLAGFGVLTLGGWLGGSVVFVHGMRVLGHAEDGPANATANHGPGREGDSGRSEPGAAAVPDKGLGPVSNRGGAP